MESLQPAVVSYWRLSGAISAIVVFVVFAVYGLPMLFVWRPLGIGVLVTGAVVALARLAWSLASSRLRYRSLAYAVHDGLVRLRYGVLVRTEKVIPIERMQHIDIDHGPVERWFGLMSLSVFTAGGRRATFRLPGLSPARAEELRAQLLRDALRNDSV